MELEMSAPQPSIWKGTMVVSWTSAAIVVFSSTFSSSGSLMGLISIRVGNSNFIFPTGTTFPPIFFSKILYPYFLAALTDSSEMKNLLDCPSNASVTSSVFVAMSAVSIIVNAVVSATEMVVVSSWTFTATCSFMSSIIGESSMTLSAGFSESVAIAYWVRSIAGIVFSLSSEDFWNSLNLLMFIFLISSSRLKNLT